MKNFALNAEDYTKKWSAWCNAQLFRAVFGIEHEKRAQQRRESSTVGQTLSDVSHCMEYEGTTNLFGDNGVPLASTVVTFFVNYRIIRENLYLLHRPWAKRSAT